MTTIYILIKYVNSRTNIASISFELKPTGNLLILNALLIPPIMRHYFLYSNAPRLTPALGFPFPKFFLSQWIFYHPPAPDKHYWQFARYRKHKTNNTGLPWRHPLIPTRPLSTLSGAAKLTFKSYCFLLWTYQLQNMFLTHT